jgi:phage terminase large subunit
MQDNTDITLLGAPELGKSFQDVCKILADPTVYFAIFQGGTSAGKTFNIMGALMCLMRAGVYAELNTETNQYEFVPTEFSIVVVGVNLTTLEFGAEKDWNTWIDAYCPEAVKSRNKTKHRYEIRGSTLTFRAVPDAASAKSIGKNHIVFMNEANHQPFAVFQMLAMRARLKTIIDYNPDVEFWAHAFIDDYRTAFRLWTYLDNINNVDAQVLDFLEKMRIDQPEKYRVYGLGLTGKTEGVIFSQYEFVDEMPAYNVGKSWTIGVDWGETKDPTTIVRICYFAGCLYAEELFYAPTPSNTAVRQAFIDAGLGNVKDPKIYKTDIYCDHRPAFINYLKDLGYLAHAARKGAQSITGGIALIKTFKLKITRSSLNLKKELEGYKYKQARISGEIDETHTEGADHLIDALRYAVTGNRDYRDYALIYTPTN